MNKLNLKLYFKKRKQRLSVFGVSITFDWRFILVIGLVLLIAGMCYAGLLYYRISNGSLFQTVEGLDPKIEIEQKRKEIDEKIETLKRGSFDEPAVN